MNAADSFGPIVDGEAWWVVRKCPEPRVVPGMVLPIVEQTDEGCPDGAHICVFYGMTGGEPTEQWVIYDGDMEQEWTDRPPAAAPGMFAVKVKVKR